MTKVGGPKLGRPLWFIKVKFVKKRTPLQQIHKKNINFAHDYKPQGLYVERFDCLQPQ